MHLKIGTTPLRVKYRDEELRFIIDEMIDGVPETIGFKDLCYKIIEKAKDEGQLDAPADASYQWLELDRRDVMRVNRILWEEINAGALVFDFDTTHYDSPDTYFMRP